LAPGSKWLEPPDRHHPSRQADAQSTGALDANRIGTFFNASS
jgi:hypothetical protein